MSPTSEQAQTRLLPPRAVAELTSLSWRTIHRKVQARQFPQPIKLSERRIAFRESDVLAWIHGLQSVAA